MKQLRLLTVFAALALALPLTLFLSAAASATEQAGPVVFDGDDFGESYFTAAAPDALSDNGDFFSADMLNNIEPAAGGDSGFILPEDAADEEVHNQDNLLDTPEDAIIPGMD